MAHLTRCSTTPTSTSTNLGIWVPERYRTAEDEITRIHTVDEPEYAPQTGLPEVLLSTKELGIGRGQRHRRTH